MPSRWELHWASVEPGQSVGTEQHNVEEEPRPWLIVSDDLVQRAKLVVACPLTKQLEKDPAMDPFRMVIDPSMVAVAPGDTGMNVAGLLLGEQIRAMSVKRIRVAKGSTRIGKLKPAARAEVEARLCAVLGLDLK